MLEMRKHSRMCCAMFIMIVPLSVTNAKVPNSNSNLPGPQGWEAPVELKKYQLSSNQTLEIKGARDIKRESIDPKFVFSDGTASTFTFTDRSKKWQYRVEFCNELQPLRQVPIGPRIWKLSLTPTSLVLECNGKTLLNFNFTADGRTGAVIRVKRIGLTKKYQISFLTFVERKNFFIRAEASRTWTNWSHPGSNGAKITKSCPKGFYIVDMAWLYRSGHGLIDLAFRCHDPDKRASQFVEFVGYERLREDGLTDRERPDSSSIRNWFSSFAVMLDISGPKARDYVNKPKSQWFNNKLSEGVKCSEKGGIDSFLGHSQSCCGLVNASFRCTDGDSWYDSGTNWNGKQNNKIQCPAGQAFVGAQVRYGATSHLKKVFKNDHQGIIDVRFRCEESTYPPVAAD